MFNKQLEEAKFSLIVDYDSVFISAVLFNLNIIEDSSIPTACTNGKEIRINKEFFGSLSQKEQVFLLAHETWHVCFNHMTRRENRDAEKWNIAADCVINLMLEGAGYSVIENALLDEQYKDMSTEQVYDSLPEDAKPDDTTGQDIVEVSGDEAKELTQQITDIVIQATAQAEMQDQIGTIPDSISRMVNEILYPELPYGVLLDKYFNDRSQDDYSWGKRNRRYADIYMPTLYSERLGAIAVYIDASGSVSSDQFNEYIALLVTTKEHYNPKKMIITSFDTEIKKVWELNDTESARDITFNGQGGTSIKPVMNHIQNNDAEVSIVITDGMFHEFIPEGFNKEIIWLIDNNKEFTYPVGEIIHIN